ncbi:SRPBCC family protein [Nocardioides marmoraquaticus]
MTRFSASKQSAATVHSSRAEVWAALTDHTLLPRLTPYLQRIDADGDTWTWHVVRIPVLGGSIGSTFVEQMSFEEGVRIGFRPHPDHPDQQTLVRGEYHLEERADDSTRVSIDIEVDADLPFPRVARPAVEAGMATVMSGMGIAFSRNLLRHLGEAS